MKTYWLLMAFLAALAGAAFAQENSAALVAQGDKLSAQNRGGEAIEMYLEADRLQPNTADILWRLGREYCHLMEYEKMSSEQIRLGRVGLYYAARASKLQPDNVMARLWNAFALQQTADLTAARGKIATGPGNSYGSRGRNRT